MKVVEAARSGLGEIMAHKMRSFLTFFAISIGTAAFMYTFAIIASSRLEIAKGIELSGPGRIEVEPDWGGGANENRSPLSYKDALCVRDQLPALYQFCPVAEANPKVSYHQFEGGISVGGVLPEWRKRDWVYTSMRGRFFNDADVQTNARVAVVMEPGDWPEGKKKSWWLDTDDEKDFGYYAKHNNMLGENLNIGGHIFNVVGVLKHPPLGEDPRWLVTRSGADVLVPITTALALFSQDGESIDYMYVDSGRAETAADTKRKIENILSARHAGKFKGWKVRDYREIMSEVMARQNKMMMMIFFIGIISLVSGGIGIMNVTLAMVYSRIKEIGTRRAIGATRGDITVQFVVEAVMLSLVGGVAGIVLGYGLILYMRADSTSTPQPLLWWIPFASLGVAAFAGFIFSIYPAYTAAKLDPVEALRYE